MKNIPDQSTDLYGQSSKEDIVQIKNPAAALSLYRENPEIVRLILLIHLEKKSFDVCIDLPISITVCQ